MEFLGPREINFEGRSWLSKKIVVLMAIVMLLKVILVISRSEGNIYEV